nr:ABC transporter ATP-binding protein [uncultured Sphaerochaeta sp.]
MITASNVSFAYPGQAPTLKGIDLHLEPGRTLGLVGANGSGKSTLLTLLAGIFAPTEGRLKVGGFNSPGQEKEIRQLTGLVLQDADLQILGATVGEDICLGVEQDETTPGEETLKIAERFSLRSLWDQPVQTLSWGQKRRLCLAAVLRKHPRILLLDEPFSGLDYPGIKEMRTILSANREAGLTQVVATHDLEPIADLTDEWAVVNAGELVLYGQPDQIFDRLDDYSVRPPCSWQAGLGVRPWDWGGRND